MPTPEAIWSDMSVLSDLKINARRELHQAMSFPASYYETAAATPLPINVRKHFKNVQNGDLKGTNLSYAEKEEQAQKLVFLRSEVEMPRSKAMVIFSATEGYRCGPTEKPDGITIKCDVTPMKPEEIAAIPDLVLPGEG